MTAATVMTRRGLRPIYASLVPFPIACFAGALVTDLAYWQTEAVQWETFSVWLISTGLVLAAVAALGLIIDALRPQAVMPRWTTVAGHVLAALLALLNAFVHSRDGYTAVVPSGLILSAAVLLILLLIGVVPARRGPAGIIASLLVFVGAVAATLMGEGATPPPLLATNQTGAGVPLPAPHQYLIPPMHIARDVGWADGAMPKVPAGLKVQLFGKGFAHPRFVYALPNGDVLVVESSGPKAPINRPKDLVMHLVQSVAGAGAKGGNRITLLRDAKGDGVPTLRQTFIDHLNSPFGVVLVGHELYVANTDAILRFDYTDGTSSIAGSGVKLVDLPAGPIDHHWTKSLIASADGSKLYVGIGSNSNITENGIGAELGRADIWEVDRATGATRIYAAGLRNPTGLQLEPQTGKLWAIANERDEIGPNLVPDYMTSVQDGGFYGWPYSYYGQHVDARVAPQRPDLVAKALVPDYALSSHVAPLGFAFYTGGNLPATYRGGAFVGEHGSWDRSPLNGYKVVFIPFSNGRPSGSPQDVVTGFLTPDNLAQGRPVGLAVDRSGALLIADDLGDAVWRVSASDH